MQQQPEYWLRGPVKEIPALLQPAAHAILQARDEIQEMMKDFPQELLWEKPAGMASPAFHLRHITGVLDRLFTYAKGQSLSEAQLSWLKNEGVQDNTVTVATLLSTLSQQVESAMNQLKNTAGDLLTETRGVGRKQIPSTVQGLLFHAAEHMQRHAGQLLVTVAVLKHNR